MSAVLWAMGLCAAAPKRPECVLKYRPRPFCAFRAGRFVGNPATLPGHIGRFFGHPGRSSDALPRGKNGAISGFRTLRTLRTLFSIFREKTKKRGVERPPANSGKEVWGNTVLSVLRPATTRALAEATQ